MPTLLCEKDMAVEMSHLATIAVFLVFAAITWRDLTQPVQADKPTKDIPTPKLAKFAGPTLKFLFW